MRFIKEFKEYETLDGLAVGSKYSSIITVKKQLVFLESGFCSYVVADEEGKEFKINGISVAPLSVNKPYQIEGTISIYKGHKQVKFSSVKLIRPKTRQGVILYLKTLKGLNKKADDLFNEFGVESIDYILNKPDVVVSKITGVGKKSIAKWQKQLKETLTSQDSITRLLEMGLSQKEAKKLYDEYKDEIVTKIEDNPYFLIREIKGYGFEKADKIAREIGISPNSKYRIEEGFVHCLRNAGQEGHCYLPKDILINSLINVLSIKITYLEMIKLKKDHQGEEKFLYSLGENLEYEVNYNDMCSIIQEYEEEKSKYKKETHKYEVFRLNEEEVNLVLDELIKSGRVIDDKDKIYIKSVYINEVTLAKNIKELIKYDEKYSRSKVTKVLDDICKRKGIELEEKQREACIEFNTASNGIYILTGGAGTGKTFSLSLILEVSKALNNRAMKVDIMAPTGRASKVASEATGMDCKTIHRGLGYRGGDFEFNEENPLDTDILVIDETSMLDLNIANTLVKALKSNIKLIFLGDIRQLPSIGAGNVLKDLINSGMIKVVMLNVLKRQGSLSGIAIMANDVIEDTMIKTSEATKDAYLLERETSKGVQSAIISSIKSIMKFDTFDNIQVLVPQKTGAIGTHMLNYLIQYCFNRVTEKDETILARKFKAKMNDDVETREYELYFKVGDKVINTTNSYDQQHYLKKDGIFIKAKDVGITNGETGVIYAINNIRDLQGKIKKREIIVSYDDYYIKYEDDFSCLEHSYALTIHKSQGSAWRNIILPITNAAFKMINNNLIYTGITRSRRFIVVIGQSSAIRYGIKKHDVLNRYTSLSERIKNEE